MPITDGEESNDSFNGSPENLSTIDLTELDDIDNVGGSKPKKSPLKTNSTIPKKRVRFSVDTTNERSDNQMDQDDSFDDFLSVTSCNGGTTDNGTDGNGDEDPNEVVTTKESPKARIDNGHESRSFDNMNVMIAKLKQQLKEVNERNAALVKQLEEAQKVKDTLGIEKKILITKIAEMEKEQAKNVADAKEQYKTNFAKLVEQTKKVKFCNGCGTTKPQDTFYFCDDRCQKQYW